MITSPADYVKKIVKITACSLLFTLSCMFFPGGGYSASSASSLCPDNSWPSEHSELVSDPSLVRGRLDNGLRYVLKKNKQPAERVAVYLDIQAGSLHEKDNQRGGAHFLEHMMFNGTEHFPPGSLVEYFQSLGMGFGGDTNAHTSHTETVYHIILPGGSEQDLESGLLVMSDYARGALLDEAEIERERGVILAEMRARDSAAYRSYLASSAFAFRGTRYPERMVIGLPKILQKLDQKLLRDYYDSWYRPENMVLVIVGAVDIELTKKLLGKHFSHLVPGAEKAKCPDFGSLSHRGLETFYHYEPELGKTNVTLQSIWDLELENDSVELQKRELLGIIGSMIMGHRLQKLQEEEKVPFVQGSYGSGNIISRIGYGSFGAEVDSGHWKQSLEYLVQLLGQALQYGFTETELGRVKKEIISQLDSRILTEASEDSRTIARRIIDHLNSNRVYQSAQQERALYGSLTTQINLQEVNRAFESVWNHNSRLVSVTGDVQLTGDVRAEIEKVYRNAKEIAVVQTAPEKTISFPYLQPPSPVEVEPKSFQFYDLEVERLVFPNGFIVNLKKTKFEENLIRLRADFGGGKLTERYPGSGMLVEEIINKSGTGRLSQSALDAILAGSSVDMSFRVGISTFSWLGSSLPGDFELSCQLLYTLLEDPGFKAGAFRRVMSDTELWYQKIGRQVEAFLPLAVKPFLAGYDDHFGLPPWQEIAGLDYALIGKWVQTFIRPKDLEISVVGDFDRDEVVAQLGKYFSGLELSPTQMVAPPSIKFPSGGKLDVQVKSSDDKSLIAIAWPTMDLWTIERARRLHLLADVFGDRVRKSIREEMAVSYSTRVSSFNRLVYNGYGYFLAHILVRPGSEDEVIEKVMKIAESLQKNGISSEELTRARKPIVTSLQERTRQNNYWLHSVLSLSIRHPQQLEWAKNLVADYNTIGQSELNKLAAKYLGRERAAIVKITTYVGKAKKKTGKDM